MTQFHVELKGMGIVSALGMGLKSNVDAIYSGSTKMSERVTSLPYLKNPNFLVGQLDIGCDLDQRLVNVLEFAFHESCENAGMCIDDLRNAGVFVGSTGGNYAHEEMAYHQERALNPQTVQTHIWRGLGSMAQEFASRFKISGPVMTFSTACTSSALAIVTAATFLEQGRLEYAIVIGVDLLSALTLEGFQSLLLYDSLGCRPFDLDRNGLNLGEGCAILILARQKSAAPSFLLTSGVSFNDNTHLTASLLDGRIVANVLSDALKRADIAPSEVVAIKAHGTGTRDNDLAEGRGIAKLFGDDVPPFSSLKAYCGHTLGAAGVLETVAWLACLARGFIPPSKGFQKLDPEIGISPAVKSQVARSGYYLFQFFGFGGSCCAFTIKFDSKGTS